MDNLTKLGFNKLLANKKALDSYAMGGTRARTEVTAAGDSTASYKNKHFDVKVKKPAGGQWTRDGKVMSPQSKGTHNFNTVNRFIRNESSLHSTKSDATRNRNYFFK